MAAPTVESLIDRARSRHWSLVDVQMPSGAIVQFLSERQRVVLLAVIDSVEPLIGATQDIETEGTATLIAVDDDGAGYFTETTEDGYALRFENGVPYIDVSQTFVSDPFGENGDVPGLPLPNDVLRYISITAHDSTNTRDGPVEIMPQGESDGQRMAGTSGLRAFISANRLVPIRQGENDAWGRVTSIKLAFVASPELTALADTITLPTALVDVLVAHIVEFLAAASPKCDERDKQRFERQRADAEAKLIEHADEILSNVTSSHVIFRR